MKIEFDGFQDDLYSPFLLIALPFYCLILFFKGKLRKLKA